MSYVFYPGCSLEGTARDFHRSTLALAAASPLKYQELARAQVLDGKTWTVPTLSSGRLFVRNEQEMVCLKWKP